MINSGRSGRGDVARQVCTVLGAVAQVVLPSVLLPRVRRSIQPPDVVQPAAWTFAVWVPIYAASLAYAAHQARPSQAADPLLREIGWPLAVAFGSTGVWAPLVSRERYWSAQAALVAVGAAAGTARRRLAVAEREDRLTAGHRRFVIAPTAGLSGWGTAAATVNLAAMIASYGPVRERRSVDVLAVATLALVSAVSTAAVRSGGPGSTTATAYGATVLWALAGIVDGQRRRSRPAAFAGAGPLLAALRRSRI
ncbi:MAG TPA: hypothetical protein VEZ42_15200 [Pseudonocardia sp.]|nr:hypothetical protein [Pseudonocardia sp.]